MVLKRQVFVSVMIDPSLLGAFYYYGLDTVVDFKVGGRRGSVLTVRETAPD